MAQGTVNRFIIKKKRRKFIIQLYVVKYITTYDNIIRYKPARGKHKIKYKSTTVKHYSVPDSLSAVAAAAHTCSAQTTTHTTNFHIIDGRTDVSPNL